MTASGGNNMQRILVLIRFYPLSIPCRDQGIGSDNRNVMPLVLKFAAKPVHHNRWTTTNGMHIRNSVNDFH